MAGKKLLYARFASTSGLIEFVLASQSSDHIPIPSPNVEYYSKDKPLNQVGCLFSVWDSIAVGNSPTRQKALSRCLAYNNGYGARCGMLPSDNSKNVPLYLNGMAVRDGEPMPYVKWVDGAYTTVLHYFRADGTDLGWMFQYVGNDSNPAFWAGQLYDDGTFTGDWGYARPHAIIPGVYSAWNYHWCVTGHAENLQLINQSIIDDLTEYLPHEPEGELTENGNGDFDSTSDPIDFPELPALSALDTGLTAMYEMTNTQLRSLSQFLWSGLFDLDTFKKMFNDPMESILNLCISPVDITTGGVDSQIRIGNINTGVNGTRVLNPYKIIDFGTLNLNEYWANYADYSPYTKLSIFLPYVGVQQISIDDVMNGSIQLKAYCDVLTGSIQYILKSRQGNRRAHGHNSVLYTWGGNCQYQIPLSASNMTSVINSIISTTTSVAGAVIATAATEGVAAPVAIAGAVGSTASGVANAKTTVQRGGGLGGAVGLFGVQTPYLILERPELITPNEYAHNVGIPNEKADYVNNYVGFVKVKECHLSIPGATADDLNEIESILKEGILV